MCGRYVIDEEITEIGRILWEIRSAYPNTELKTGEIFPTDTAPILRGVSGEPIPARWGFPMYGRKGEIINARSETVREKRSFCACWENGRCIVPISGYYEWSDRKDKYRFRLPGRETLFLAGLCRQAGDTVQYVILTVPANVSVSAVHRRMPLIVTDEAMERWLSDAASAAEYLRAKMPQLVYEQV